MNYFKKNLVILLSLTGLCCVSLMNNVQAQDKEFNLKITKEKFNDVSGSIVIPVPEESLDLDKIYYPGINSTDLSGLDILSTEKLKARLERKIKRRKNNIEPENVPSIYDIDLSTIREQAKNQVYKVSLKTKYANLANAAHLNNNFQNNLDDVRKLIEHGELKKASATLDKLATKSKKDSWYLVELAENYEKLGKYGKASLLYEKAEALNPDRIEILYNYAHNLYKLEKFDKAEKYMNKILALNPEFTLAYYDLGNIYFKKKQYYKALEFFNKSVKINPISEDTYYNIALILELTGKKDLALKYYNKCLELEPADFQAQKAIKRLGNN